jgi:hypothetical protein
MSWFNGGLIEAGGNMLEDQMIVLSGLRNLRIASNNGAPGNEYRIQRSAVEFRTLNANGEPYGNPRGQWRTLDNDEIQLHFALHTPVADWLDKNLYSSSAP